MHTHENPSFFARMREGAKRLQLKASDTFDANQRLIRAIGFGWTIVAITFFLIEHWPWDFWRWPMAAWY